MSEIDKARKDILYQVALEMDLDVQSSMKVAKLRELIKSSPLFEDGEFVNSLVKNTIAINEEKLRIEALEEKRKADELELEKRKIEMNFELEKLRLQVPDSAGAVTGNAAHSSTYSENKYDVQKLLPTFRAESDDITLFLVLLERQLKLSKVPKDGIQLKQA